jgi:DNA-binding NtrC family response regulator
MSASAGKKPPAQGSAPALLVVEDEPLIRMDLADCLRVEGFLVIEASGPDEARAFLSSGVAIQCVLTDLHMPHRDDGLGLLRWLGQERPDLPVFIASGVPDSLELAKQERVAIVDAFEKPYHPDTIARRVRALLQQEASS